MRVTRLPAQRLPYFGRMVVAMLLLLGGTCIAASDGPQPGQVYREFAAHQGGDNWRVTNPLAKDPRARKFLPNPVLPLRIEALRGAIRAEAVLDRWGGHISTKHPRIRFNGHAWLDVPPPTKAPGDGDHERYYFQDNPVVAVPLEYLKEGDNTFEGTCSHEAPDGWGQWGLYSLILRVYYDPAAVPHPTGRIVSPSSDATLGENPVIRVQASSVSEVARVDVLAWYDGYDEDGDGVFVDWHGAHFQPRRGEAAELRDHAGTVRRAPYELTWNTRWVPDQPPRTIKLIARIQDTQGRWYVAEPVTGLTLRRDGESVRQYRTGDVPPRFGVRNGQAKSCTITIPANHDLPTAVEAGLHYRTWHGWDKHHKPFQLNGLAHRHEGNNHHYDYDVLPIPIKSLRNGDNTFTISSETEHHMLEVLWPGPALTVRYRIGEPR